MIDTRQASPRLDSYSLSRLLLPRSRRERQSAILRRAHAKLMVAALLALLCALVCGCSFQWRAGRARLIFLGLEFAGEGVEAEASTSGHVRNDPVMVPDGEHEEVNDLVD